MKKIGWNVFSAVAIFGGLLLVWVGVIWAFGIPPYMLPSPVRVVAAGVNRFGSLMHSLEISTMAAVGGLVGAVTGILDSRPSPAGATAPRGTARTLWTADVRACWSRPRGE